MIRSLARFVTAALLVATSAHAKPRTVDLMQELQSARLIMRGRVTGYDPRKATLTFEPQAPAGRPMSLQARWIPDPVPWTPLSVPAPDAGAPRAGSPTFTATWPPVGVEVVAVLSAPGTVSLFAHAEDEGSRWRFWSPQATGSVALFRCRPPSLPIEPSRPGEGWDGCTLPAEALRLTPTSGR